MYNVQDAICIYYSGIHAEYDDSDSQWERRKKVENFTAGCLTLSYIFRF
jgi:hypothetical protein